MTKEYKKTELLDFCRLASINCKNMNKTEIYSNIKQYLDKYKYAPRYLRGLTEDEKYLRKFEIKYGLLKEKELKSKDIEYKDVYKPTLVDKIYREKKGIPNKTIKYSKYTERWNQKYPDCKNLECKSKTSGIPLHILKSVSDKGAAAWRSGAHRPGATRENWMVSRVNSFLLCGKTWQFPDHTLAKEALKSPKVKKFWKNCNFDMLGVKTPSR
jgi:hypothetical protein